MTIKIYNILGIGLVMGEKLKQDDEKIYLKYPGVALPNQQTKQGLQHIMIEPVHDFFSGKDDLLNNFPIKKIHVIYSGTPSLNAMKLYEDYSKKLRERLTGIKTVDAGILGELPRNGKGEPILN